MEVDSRNYEPAMVTPAAGGGSSICMVSGPLPERRRSEPAPRPPKHIFRISRTRRVSIGPSVEIRNIPSEDGEKRLKYSQSPGVLYEKGGSNMPPPWFENLATKRKEKEDCFGNAVYF
ncbi:hypothetical protein HOLleu_13998 [Holothuria leucospilota]|uniref:Uncharacterized protein n=1 Tax=Holothuria leucospilota TaxID=206669 RepID=A0A9Q1C7X5_HOLLE|nr:hypothetical protein HOLleu_13998 [Holothuria leucospilota]